MTFNGIYEGHRKVGPKDNHHPDYHAHMAADFPNWITKRRWVGRR